VPDNKFIDTFFIALEINLTGMKINEQCHMSDDSPAKSRSTLLGGWADELDQFWFHCVDLAHRLEDLGQSLEIMMMMLINAWIRKKQQG
jgi:hypothetical protein